MISPPKVAVNQRTWCDRNDRLGHIEQAVNQQYIAQLHSANTQRLAMRPQQPTGLERQQRHQQRVDHQHHLRPLRPHRQQQQGEPHQHDRQPDTRQPHLGKAQHPCQKNQCATTSKPLANQIPISNKPMPRSKAVVEPIVMVAKPALQNSSDGSRTLRHSIARYNAAAAAGRSR